jgi:hypothetical protein
MYFFIVCLLLGGGWYLRKWFLSDHPLPAIAHSSLPAARFESFVPTAGSEELVIEIDNDFEKEWEQFKPVLIEEADTVLLLEAEKLIEEVDAATASKVDVYGKLRAIVPGYMMLYKTEYYDPINKLIFQLVQSECGIELTDAELVALWK